MTEKDKAVFAVVMLGLAENYGQTITKNGMAMRFESLKQFDITQVKQAALSIMTSRKYTTMPTVADFLEHMGGGCIEDKAEVEAGKVLQAICDHGGYRSVVFDDPTTQAVIRQAYGGWSKLCAECGVDEPEKWFRHNFTKTWAAYKRQGVQSYGALPGLHEIQNAASGNASLADGPRLVGDPAKAKAVLEQGEYACLQELDVAQTVGALQ